MMTYSFPCQDLSKAGSQKGMSKGSNTRSGLLWEVERLLNETSNLPHILMMENVTQVHNKKNIVDFEKWLSFLESKGYHNYWSDLSAKDYGVPQNRKRTFMISLLNDTDFEFPKPIGCYKQANLLLESPSIVREEYNLNPSLITYLTEHSKECEQKGWGFRFKPRHREEFKLAFCITTRCGARMDDNFVKEINEDRIRRLTELEAFRFMGVNDDDAEKMINVNTSHACYSLAGNSIVVDVMYHIFKQMMPSTEERLSNFLETL